MTIPFWKRIFSYLFEIHVESAPSDLNPHLYVSIRNGRYQLCTANAIYSYGDLYYNFKEAFENIDIKKLPGKRVLILGFGLGSIPVLMEKTYRQKFEFTAVEIDESVIYLAEKYAMDDIQSPVQIIEANALAFCHQCQEKFDIIAVDIFQDEQVPEEFENPEFLDLLMTLLDNDGLLLFNRLANTPSETAKTQRYFENVFLAKFPMGNAYPVWGNWMLVNDTAFLDQEVLDSLIVT